ncbi:Molybdopterin biosynthesis MoaE [Cokeromyces recurvatus]|uniref:Molybdopterin biosynthesis MoaE n=1 Tax=Cokeromyces recurvatus TaxID=90255 RepID=UPI002220064B|nr:Molybdopterin biosynthesis MoaE [Cokeromyces recurvatus]KAI7898136.1 Molybdopterin biosynthesis MoaE [Cokeromyces recurvatus]
MKNIVEISSEPLPSLDEITSLVQDDRAGAITTFSGTTRNVFEDKTVVELEYEAYIPMAKKILMELIEEARNKWNLLHVAIYHRTGIVPVGKVSVVVATSSKHRADSMDSARYLIDELKDRCPIWKREVYEDGSVWKGACNKKH